MEEKRTLEYDYELMKRAGRSLIRLQLKALKISVHLLNLLTSWIPDILSRRMMKQS